MTSENFLRNAFQMPNWYADSVIGFLTPEEVSVLLYLVRRIFGFQKRKDRISYSQFSGGAVKADGSPRDFGTGLSERTVKKALDGLIRAGMVIRLEQGKPNGIPALYSLQLNPEDVNYDFLKSRRAAKDLREKERMENARNKRGERTGCVRGVVPHTGGLCDTTVEGYAITRKGGTPLQTQKTGNKEENNMLSFISSLNETEKEFISQVGSISLDGTLNEKQVQHWLSQREEWGAEKVLGFLEWAQQQGHSFAQAFNIDRKYGKVQDWQFSRRGESRVEFIVDENGAVTPWEVWETGRREKCRVEKRSGKMCYVTHDGFDDELPRLGEREGSWEGGMREFTRDGWIELEPSEGQICGGRMFMNGEWCHIPVEGDFHFLDDYRILLHEGDVYLNQFESFHDGQWIPATVEEVDEHLKVHRWHHTINLITESEPAIV